MFFHKWTKPFLQRESPFKKIFTFLNNYIPVPLPNDPRFSMIFILYLNTSCTCPTFLSCLLSFLSAATFAMEISVEHDMRTGESQVVSMATVTPQEFQEKGVKVFDDGRKTVYALHPDGRQPCDGAVGEMTPVEVEELLRQATDKKVPSNVQYHQPVYSAPYTGSSRPSTPRTPNKTPRQTPTPSPSQTKTLSINGPQSLGEEKQLIQESPGYSTTSKIPSPGPYQQDAMPRDGAQSREETKQSHIPNLAHTDNHLIKQSQAQSSRLGNKTPQSLTNGCRNLPTLVSVTARSEGMPSPMHTVYRTGETHSPLLAIQKSGDSHSPAPLLESTIDSNRQSPFYPESETSFNLNSLPDNLESGPITMIFMGYQNAEAEDEDEEEDIQAELVVICNSDDDDEVGDKNGKNDNGADEFLSYHPEGYKSKIFQPQVGVAKVAGHRDVLEEAYTNCDDVLPHKPTFTHKPGKRSPCPDRQGVDEPTNPGSLNLDKIKCCSTERSQ